jgi:alpha-galactosidase
MMAGSASVTTTMRTATGQSRRRSFAGLKPVIDRVHALGMDFGIWGTGDGESDSDLYRQHPEWAMQFPNREHSEERNQLMLNLAADVKE